MQWCRIGLIALTPALSLAGEGALAADPLATVRAFCREDGNGARLQASSWPKIADLVEWQLEPAWDHVRLIAGYELGTPRTVDGRIDVDVRYTVTAEVRAAGVTRERRVETRTYALAPDGAGGWRIKAPAPPPYVFESQADADALRTLLDPEQSDYVSAPAFVWQLLRSAGWELPYADVAGLASAAQFTAARTPEVGDLAFYHDGERPYHVGLVESDETLVSATLNGGIRRTPFAAFAGEIRYRRAVRSDEVRSEESGVRSATPSAPVMPTLEAARRQTPDS
jgi:hypothetical protein